MANHASTATGSGRTTSPGGLEVPSTGKTIAWLLLAVAIVANIAGYTLDLYQQFWWFDRVLHGGTIFALTLWLSLIVFAPGLQRGQTVRTFLLVVSVGLAIGALWEVAEWAYDQIAAQNVIKGKFDTVLDIIMDTVGAVLASVLSLRLSR